MPQKKTGNKTKVRSKKRRRKPHKWRYFFHKNGHLRPANILLTVVLLSLLSLQVLRWVGQHRLATWEQQTETQQGTTVDEQRQQFLDKIAGAAQADQKQYHLRASITLAQAALESDWGRSTLATKYNNLFGIKDRGPDATMMTTKEYVNGQWITVKAPFAVYSSWADSVHAHTMLIVNGTKWDPNHYQAVLAATNYQEAAQTLQRQGYATDPTYAEKLINVIKKYHLDRYDS